MRIVVLGAAAGGGFPQWNCNCRNCAGFRNGTVRARRRTQSSLAISSDSLSWVLINASPDILTQLAATPVFQPAREVRDTAIRAIVLVDGQIDHTVGLFMLREGGPLEVYCTASVREDLTGANPIFRVLGSYCGVNWRPVPTGPGSSFEIPEVNGLRFSAVPVASKPSPFSPHRNAPAPDDNIGLLIEEPRTGQTVWYAPALARVDERVAECMKCATCILVDGTFWSDDEMIRLGVGSKRASQMGHLAQAGPDGMIAALKMQRALKDRDRAIVSVRLMGLPPPSMRIASDYIVSQP